MVVGKTLLAPRHSLNAFFSSPSQLDVRTGGSQQKLTARFAFSSIHKLKFDAYNQARQSSQYTSNFNLCILLKIISHLF